MLLIGLDAASQWKNFGFAIGRFDGVAIDIQDAGLIDRDGANALVERIAPLLAVAERAIVAIDAPLGWPAMFGVTLAQHRAGDRLEPSKDDLFRRNTDQQIRKRTRKNPLEIGADKIARAAHQALHAIDLLRQHSKRALPLAWSVEIKEPSVIEVYPAATLISRGLSARQYKKTENVDARMQIVRGLKAEMPRLKEWASASGHAFDACLCLVAAKDFAEGKATAPVDVSLAKHEGWIWCRESK